MSKVLDTIVHTKPREIAGSRSSSAFAYQRNWALAKMLNCHLNKEDYVFIFEYHDDILKLDNEKEPTRITFFQVKTSSSTWSIVKLTNRKENKNSILGKLFSHKIDFRDLESEICFVTDSSYNFKKDSDYFCYSELDEKHRKEIKERIQSEIQKIQEHDFDTLYFEKSKIAFSAHESTVKGLLVEFLEEIFGRENTIPVNVVFQALNDEIKFRNNYSPKDINDAQELIRKKSVSKSLMDKFINDLKIKQDKVMPQWTIIEGELRKIGYQAFEIIKIHNSWIKYSVDILNTKNDYLQKLTQKINNNFSEYVDEKMPLKQVLIEISNSLKNESIIQKLHLSEDYIKAIILWVYCERATL